jgi:hypothetical protein
MFHPVSKGIIAILIGLVATGGAAAGAAHAATLTSSQPSPTVAPQPTTQGIIMSDGRICNPRWGC